jgi:hypothetical protein
VKPVYLAALRLKMDRAAAECARFLASHLDIGSCLEIRSTPGVTNKPKKASADAEESKAKPKERKGSKDSNKNGSPESVGHHEYGGGGAVKEASNGDAPENGAEVEQNGEGEKHVDLVTVSSFCRRSRLQRVVSFT